MALDQLQDMGARRRPGFANTDHLADLVDRQADRLGGTDKCEARQSIRVKRAIARRCAIGLR